MHLQRWLAVGTIVTNPLASWRPSNLGTQPVASVRTRSSRHESAPSRGAWRLGTLPGWMTSNSGPLSTMRGILPVGLAACLVVVAEFRASSPVVRQQREMVCSPQRPQPPEMPLVERQQPRCAVTVCEHYVSCVRDPDVVAVV